MEDTARIVHINFKVYLDDSDSVVDTNIEECAKENDIYNEELTYAPFPYIVGSGRLYSEVDSALATAEVGKEIDVAVPCEDAAGARDPKNIQLLNIREFYKLEMNPYPGMRCTINNRTGTVLSVGSGRVKVDFNSPLAGHDLLYKVTVVDEVTDPVEKAKAVMDIDFGYADEFGYAIMDDKIVVTVCDVCKFHESWPISKYRIVSDYRSLFKLDRIEFVEVWESFKDDGAEAEESE